MVESPFNYTGNKFKLLNQLLPLFDYSKQGFIDLFAGGGSVYANVLDKYDTIYVNDIISELILIHSRLLEDDSIIDNTKKICLTLKDNQQDFIDLRESFNNNKSPEKLWALMLSCNSNLIRFNQSGLFNQTWGRRSWNYSTDKKVELFKNHIRGYKNKIYFSSKNFKDVFLVKDTFYYIDPPYGYVKNEDGTIGNKQISEAGYNNFYYQQDDVDLHQYCHKINNIGSTFVISGVLKHGGKTSWILDKLIKDGFNYQLLDFDYEKINKTGSKKETQEIIIKNF